jgi:hypothetical protein
VSDEFNRGFKFEMQLNVCLMNTSLAFWLELPYRKAVASQSPGLLLRLPWVTGLNGRFNRNAVASAGATRSGLTMIWNCLPRVEATLGFET